MEKVIELAKVFRGDKVESIHYGIACLANSSCVIKAWGDAGGFKCYTRSAIKPIQAKVALNIIGPELKDEILAIAISSHQANAEQLKAVQDLMSRFNIVESELKCGIYINKHKNLSSSMIHNCSGKHSALIAACKSKGWPTHNYDEISHPLQELIHVELKQLLQLSPEEQIFTASDGCTIPTFYLSIEEMSKLFANMLEQAMRNNSEQYLEIIKTMNKYPDLIGGPEQIDSMIMREYPNKFIAKGGAEGLLVVANLETAEALTIKIMDGGQRKGAKEACIIGILESLGWIKENSLKFDNNVYNSRGHVVGQIVSKNLPEFQPSRE